MRWVVVVVGPKACPMCRKGVVKQLHACCSVNTLAVNGREIWQPMAGTSNTLLQTQAVPHSCHHASTHLLTQLRMGMYHFLLPQPCPQALLSPPWVHWCWCNSSALVPPALPPTSSATTFPAGCHRVFWPSAPFWARLEASSAVRQRSATSLSATSKRCELRLQCVVDLRNGKKQRVHVAQLLDRLPGSNAARPVVFESEVGLTG